MDSLSPVDRVILHLLRYAEWRVPRAQLVEHLQLRAPTVSELLGNLDEQGLVKRYPDGWTVTQAGWEAAGEDPIQIPVALPTRTR